MLILGCEQKKIDIYSILELKETSDNYFEQNNYENYKLALLISGINCTTCIDSALLVLHQLPNFKNSNFILLANNMNYRDLIVYKKKYNIQIMSINHSEFNKITPSISSLLELRLTKIKRLNVGTILNTIKDYHIENIGL